MFAKELQHLENIFKNFNLFISRNNNAMELLFLMIYSLEQMLLVYFTLNAHNHIEYIISIFVIIFFLTFALQKLCLEIRTKSTEKLLNKSKMEKSLIQNDAEILHNKNRELSQELEEMYERYEEITKSLNKRSPSKKGRVNE
ncbi:hypothetical protein HZA98_04990 [Candidatus Woesearchaeota archaeon]|nr:hypothetical protein [Candidatus Woesearchaeota archaeon]